MYFNNITKIVELKYFLESTEGEKNINSSSAVTVEVFAIEILHILSIFPFEFYNRFHQSQDKQLNH